MLFRITPLRTLAAASVAAYVGLGVAAINRICKPPEPRSENHADMICLADTFIKTPGINLVSQKFVLGGALVIGTLPDGTSVKALYSSERDTFTLSGVPWEAKKEFGARLETACAQKPGATNAEVVAAMDMAP